MGIALGHGEPPKPEDTPPLIAAVHALAGRATRLFDGFPQALQRAVRPLCKVRRSTQSMVLAPAAVIVWLRCTPQLCCVPVGW